MSRMSRSSWFFAGMVLILSGCSTAPEVGTVTGRLEVGGDPLDDVWVQFWDKADVDRWDVPIAPYGVARTDGEGNLIFTPLPKGRVWRAGRYIVCILDRRPVLPGSLPTRFPLEYWKVHTSPLEVDILGGDNELPTMRIPKPNLASLTEQG